MPFKNSNVAVGLPKNSSAQVGVTDIDSGLIIERNIQAPVANTDEATWLYFDCSIEVMLDSGIVVHNTLPQVDNDFDTLASEGYANGDLTFRSLDNGVNLNCKDQYTDIMQRMGHARYWFRIWGKAMRLGKRIPIPGLKTIGGVAAIPYDKNPQWAYNSIVPGGNFGGVPLWRAAWSLWYTTLTQPRNIEIPSDDLAAHISDNATSLTSIQVPFSQADDNAIPISPQLAALAQAINTNTLSGK